MAQPNDKTILKVESRQSIALPLNLVIRDGALQVLPQIEARGLLHIQFRRGQVLLTAGKYIGLIPLTDNISVDVRPKLPVSNLGRVLDQSRVSIDYIKGSDRLYLKAGNGGISVAEFLLTNLLNELSQARIFGLHKEYRRKILTSSNPRGRIRVNNTIARYHSRGIRHVLAQEVFEQSSDIQTNRVIRSALQQLVEALVRGSGDKALISEGNRAFLEFPDSTKSASPNDYDECKRAVVNRSLSENRDYYYRPLEISLLVLSGRSIDLDNRGDDLKLDSLIVDFETVFEQYVRRCLAGRATGTVKVKDGNNEGRKRLFDDRKDPPAQPDIILEDWPNRQKAIIEVKYKDKPDRADINQAVTYAVTYRTDRAVLLHQSKIGGAGGLTRLGIINGITIDAYGFDLARMELEQEEAAMAQALFGVLAASRSYQPLP